MADWHSEELTPRHDVVREAKLAYPAEVAVEHGSYFRDGDLIAFPRTGDRAFVTGVDGDLLTLNSRHVRYVDTRWVGTREHFNGDEWVEVDIYEPLAIPHWYVRNLEARPGDQVFNVGAAYPER